MRVAGQCQRRHGELAAVKGQAIDRRRAKTLGIGRPIERAIADGERFDIDATVGRHAQIGVDTSTHVVMIVGIGTACPSPRHKFRSGAVELGAYNKRVVEDADAGTAIKPIASLGDVEQMVGLVDRHIADLLILTVAADKARIIGHAVDHRWLAAIEIGPPQFVALAPVEFVANRIDGDLQRFRGVNGQPAHQHCHARAVEIGAQDLAWLGIIALFHFAPVEFASAFINGDVGDNLPWALDNLHPPVGVAEHGAFDGVG